jgi:hypothetical protein
MKEEIKEEAKEEAKEESKTEEPVKVDDIEMIDTSSTPKSQPPALTEVKSSETKTDG